MPTIYCPNCEQVIPDDMTVCENCGFDLASVDDENAGPVSPKELVVEKDVLNVNKKVPAGQGKNLSEDEIQKLIAGNLVDLKISEEEKAAAAAKLAEAPISAEQETDIMSAVESTVAASAPDTIAKIDDEKLSEFFAETEDITAGAVETIPTAAPQKTEEKKSNPMMYWIITVLAAVVAAGIGFLSCYLLFCLQTVEFETDFTLRSAKAVQSTFKNGETLIVYDSYVRFDAASTECIIFGVVQNGVNNDSISLYRVVVTNEESNVVKVYFELSDDAYNAMKNSPDTETSIQASVLKNYSDTIHNCAADIASGNKKWFKADSNYVNEKLGEQKTSAESTVTTTATAAPSADDDIEDIQ